MSEHFDNKLSTITTTTILKIVGKNIKIKRKNLNEIKSNGTKNLNFFSPVFLKTRFATYTGWGKKFYFNFSFLEITVGIKQFATYKGWDKKRKKLFQFFGKKKRFATYTGWNKKNLFLKFFNSVFWKVIHRALYMGWDLKIFKNF